MPQISLEPDMCCEHICFEVEDYAPMVMTDLPDYSGVTTVTPSMDVQTLETANTALHDNITVEAIPYDEVEAATPVISVDSGGKVTAATSQQGGIVESSTKSAEYQQPTVEQATPTISVDNAGKITASATQTAGFVAAGTKSASYSLPTQAARTVTPSTAAQTAVSAGKWTTGAVEVAAMPTAAQAVPSISMSGGTITATAEQQAGYVEAGTKQAQMSLPTATAATIIPSTVSQQAIGAGTFALGSIGVAPIPSEYIVPSGTFEIAQNGTFDITQYSAASVNVSVPPQPSGTLSISENGAYDVASYANANVNVAGGGGITADDLATTGLTGSIYITASIIRSSAFCYQNVSAVDAPNVTSIGVQAFNTCSNLSAVNFPIATKIGNYAFQQCTRLSTASFPAVTYVGGNVFSNCYSLTTVNFPVATYVGGSTFVNCSNLTNVNFPALKSIDSAVFSSCKSLATVDFPSVEIISASAFYNCQNLSTARFPAVKSFMSSVFRNCYRLIELRLDGVSAVPTLGISAFLSSPIGGYSASAGQYGSVFVPASLYQSFLTADNWSSISSRIVSV